MNSINDFINLKTDTIYFKIKLLTKTKYAGKIRKKGKVSCN